MEFVIDPAISGQLVAFARQIAVERGYPVLIRGLQPAEDYEVAGKKQPGLISKRDAELLELRQAIREGKGRIWWLSEAADILYYSVCLDEVKPDPARAHAWFVDTLATIDVYGIDQEEVEAAALAKYALRAGRPYRKDKETQEERAAREEQENATILAAIADVLDTMAWPGTPIQELAERWDIPIQTLYRAINSGHIPSRQSTEKKSMILVNARSQKWRAWLKRYLERREREP